MKVTSVCACTHMRGDQGKKDGVGGLMGNLVVTAEKKDDRWLREAEI